MAGPLATFATKAQHELERIQEWTEVPPELERKVGEVLGIVRRLRQEAKALSGHAKPALISGMDAKLADVRRATETFKDYVMRADRAVAHKYSEGRNELARLVGGTAAVAAGYFGDEVARHNPSALRDSTRSHVISVQIERGNDSSSRYAS
ncbi:hypothetical protein [Phytohabitans rumicis]|uniref:Uncharacterized protein n=1 Tax=Phytohabitans rumicis TaxID=1076125 RepID=A0A6V8LH21_9ACTN|nr:hypothetical protein [Phytohabitans rumicis]GFJ93387.1 hypothetical protein Prum_070290 [Phytohabitans rumicis]